MTVQETIFETYNNDKCLLSRLYSNFDKSEKKIQCFAYHIILHMI